MQVASIERKNPRGANELSPEMTILKLYDIGIEACEKHDKSKVGQVVNVLSNSLDFASQNGKNSSEPSSQKCRR